MPTPDPNIKMPSIGFLVVKVLGRKRLHQKFELEKKCLTLSRLVIDFDATRKNLSLYKETLIAILISLEEVLTPSS